jgi:hypothetical protein
MVTPLVLLLAACHSTRRTIAGEGCRSTAPSASSFHRWGWEDADDARTYLDRFRHIFLACIYEDEWRDQGPRQYSLYRAKATVVQTYKGDWHRSERVRYVQGVDSPVAAGFTSNAGKLVFLLTNEHTKAELGFEAGTFYDYEPELERVMEFLYRGRRGG